MGYLIYLSGVVFVFTTLWLWNGSLERNSKLPAWDKEDNKVGLMTAVFSALLSWGSVLLAIFLAIVALVIYGLSESGIAKKSNAWFKQEKLNET